MRVTPGPLPNNGDRADAAVFVEKFVRETEIDQLSAINFKNTNLTFGIAQTEAPSDPEFGWMWFKRGEGVLYCYMQPDAGLFGSRADWTAVGGRREYWVRAAQTVQLGHILSPACSASSSHLHFGSARSPIMPFVAEHGTTNVAGLPLLVAAESGDSGSAIKAVEVGYTNALLDTAQTSTPGQAQMGEDVSSAFGRYGFLRIQTETNPTNYGDFGWYYIGQVIQSAPTNVTLRKMFKKFRPTAWISKVS